MKKIYQTPEMKIVKIETTHIMAGSEYLEITEETTNDASGAEGRSSWGNLWDDED